MELIEKALEYEKRKMKFPTTSDRIMAAREAKDLILSLNVHFFFAKVVYENLIT